MPSRPTRLEAAKAAEKGVEELGIPDTLTPRASKDPINIVATLLFFGAIIHTFAAGPLMKLAHKFERDHHERLKVIPVCLWRASSR